MNIESYTEGTMVDKNTIILHKSPEDFNLEFIRPLNFKNLKNIEAQKYDLYRITLAHKIVCFIEVIKPLLHFAIEPHIYLYKIINEDLLEHIKEYKSFDNLKTEKDELLEYPTKKIHLFVLELSNGYMYVGITKNVQEAFKDYNKGYTEWSKRHKAIKILFSREIGYDYDEAIKKENKETEKLMRSLGYDKVRGGKYLDISTEDITKYILPKKTRQKMKRIEEC